METNPISVAKALLEMVKVDFSEFSATATPSNAEKQLAEKIRNQFYSILTDYTFEEDTILDVASDSQVSSYSEELIDDAGLSIKKEYADKVPLKRKIEILKFVASHPKWSVQTIQNQGYKEYKHHSYKSRWTEQIKRGGTVFEKYDFIDDYVHGKFDDARKEFKFVKERDLQLWGIQAAQTFRDTGFQFKAGQSWVRDFKLRHKISSRKVTKLIGRREILTMESILESAQKFQTDFRQLSLSFRPQFVLNTDQVGFMYEVLGNRTLSFTGEKDTLGVAKSPTNLATHSYTAQYVISMAGKIVGDVFLCLQERSGRLGPQVQRDCFPASNVALTCSVSGKLTTSLFEYFLDNVVVRNVKENFLFLIDSWPGQTNSRIYADRFGGIDSPTCTVKIIPKKCTSICQPLDTTFHRQLKYFARAIYSEASLRYSSDTNPSDEVTTRNNIIRMHSLLHNQLNASIFEPMIKYSWYSSGLTDERPLFLSVKDACFTFGKTEAPICGLNCGNPRFVKCAHCRKNLCFVCFYYDYHFHPIE